jgi:hypothetical protein
MLRKYPAGDFERDHKLAPKRDGEVKLGKFGAIVYTYRLALESQHQTNIKPQNQGRLYHPVDNAEEASYWLDFYRKKTVAKHYEPKSLYESAWFIPVGET